MCMHLSSDYRYLFIFCTPPFKGGGGAVKGKVSVEERGGRGVLLGGVFTLFRITHSGKFKYHIVQRYSSS